jgi:hypothetical protein
MLWYDFFLCSIVSIVWFRLVWCVVAHFCANKAEDLAAAVITRFVYRKLLFFYTAVPLLPRSCHTVVTLLLHCCYTVVTLLSHCCHTGLLLPTFVPTNQKTCSLRYKHSKYTVCVCACVCVCVCVRVCFCLPSQFPFFDS